VQENLHDSGFSYEIIQEEDRAGRSPRASGALGFALNKRIAHPKFSGKHFLPNLKGGKFAYRREKIFVSHARRLASSCSFIAVCGISIYESN
jgi:hypothetical protein